MAARSPKFADSPDLDQSIQIALDAAEASMDVTAEFERISAQFEQTVSAAQRLEKTSRIALMVGGGVAVFAVLLMGMIWQRSSSGLERLSATNTELLTILAENVSTMDEKLAPIVAIDSQMAQLRGELTSLNESVSAVAQALDDTSAFKADLTAMTEMLSALDTLENAQMRSDAVQQEIGDRIATLNGELAMNVSTVMRDTFAAQSDAFAEMITSMSQAADATGNSANAEEFVKIKEQMETRLQEIAQRVNRLQAGSSAATGTQSPSRQDPDIIKFP
jgi:prefoldin subunit 5